jgi:fatty acid desaturase
MPAQHHEFEAIRGNLLGPHEATKGSSRWHEERTFGFTMAVILGILQGLWWTGHVPHFLRSLTDWAGGAEAVARGMWIAAFFMALAALVCPVILWPINKAWMGLAEVLGAVMGRLVISVIYFVIVTPIGLLRVRFGGDPMRRRIDPEAESYWQPREKTEFDRERCAKQY